jgi:hypothetical protein
VVQFLPLRREIHWPIFNVLQAWFLTSLDGSIPSAIKLEPQ